MMASTHSIAAEEPVAATKVGVAVPTAEPAAPTAEPTETVTVTATNTADENATSTLPPELAEGKRLLIKGDLDEAAAQFESGLQKLVSEHGELADICAEAYHLYGSALLKISKRDTSIFAENGGGAEEDGAANAEEGEEDVSTFQIAWEVLECARIILQRQNSPESMKRLATVFFELGEYQLEAGLFEESVAEFVKSRDLRKKYLPTTSRLLAETYYTLALAYSNSGKLSNAVTEFGYTHSILKANINAMRDNPKSKVEMEGLEEVAAEVREKIVDLKAEIQSKESSQATPAALPNAEVTPVPSRPAVYSGKGKGKARVDPMGGAGGTTSIGFGSTPAAESSGFAKPVGTYKHAAPNDISSLVKKRAKIEPATPTTTKT
eukprot:m.44589 g.44589  ORF g.44589 m.44589 type:complete len:379 (-) comp8557_c0_seq1:142-1278(-)